MAMAYEAVRTITDPDALAELGTDESGIFHAAGIEAAYLPTNSVQVASVLRQANETGRSVTVSGAGTGLTGGRVAVDGGWVLSTRDLRIPTADGRGERLETTTYGQRVEAWLDREAREVLVPAGLSLETLAGMLPAELLYPPDPTEQTATVGGSIATNASGARTFRYGPTRDWVKGLRVVLPTGDTVQVRRGEVFARGGWLGFRSQEADSYAVPVPGYTMPAVKNAAGLYAAPEMDLVDLFIGAEGILGVVTEAWLGLAEAPQSLVGHIAFLPDTEAGLGYVEALREASEAGALGVLSLEYFDHEALSFMGHAQGGEGKAVAVYTELDADLDELDALMDALEAHGCEEDWLAQTADELHEQKAFRHSLPEAINSTLRERGSQKLGTDFAVPGDRLGWLVEAYEEARQAYAAACGREGPHLVTFGHIGDNHLHANFIALDGAELDLAKGLYVELAQKVVAVGGTISGEHGVGRKTVPVDGRSLPYLELLYGRQGLEQIARAKRAVDPRLVLNVGDMVPREYLKR